MQQHEAEADRLYTTSGDPTTQLTRENRIASVAFDDLQVRYSTTWDGTIAIGANNVFDKEVPVFYSQPNANVSYNGAYDLDRFIYAKYTQRF